MGEVVKFKYKDVMLDIETLGKGENAVVVQVAGAFFDRVTGEVGDVFSARIKGESEVKCGFELDKGTMEWWEEQRKGSVKDWMSNGRDSAEVWEAWINWVGEANVWSHATFDWVICQRHLKAFGLQGMRYKGAMDIRTLVDVSGLDLEQFDWKKKTHDALDDVLFQVEYCVAAFKKLRGEV